MAGPVESLFAGLTSRGRCLIASGLAASLCALVLREINLLRIGVFLLALPVVSYLFVARTRYRLTCTRRVEPARVNMGDEADVLIELQNVSRLPTGLLLAEDTVPYVLGGRSRFVLDRLLPQRKVSVRYPVNPQHRGRFRIGPLAVRLTDPFGLCELGRSFTASDLLTVTPRVFALPIVPLGGARSGAGDSIGRSIAMQGEDDAATREYRLGDDLRRIHWRSTARRGELMVRREEQPWQRRAVILLDCRGVVHHGDGPTSSLEWAISAAASVGVNLSRAGFAVRLVTDDGEDVTRGTQGVESFESVALDTLAVQTASHAISMHAGIAALRGGSGDEMTIAVVGGMTAEDAQEFARVRQGSAWLGVAIVMDTATWTTLAPRAAAAAREAHQVTCRSLVAAGWRVLPVDRDSTIAEVWAQAGGPGAAPVRPIAVGAVT